MNNVQALRARAVAALAIPTHPPFKSAPVLAPDPTDPARERHRRTHKTAVATRLYMSRTAGSDRLGVLPPDYLSKVGDLVASGRRYPVHRMPAKYKSGMRAWEDADAAAARAPREAAAVHVILSLPPEGSPESWQHLVEDFCDEALCALGMLVDWAVHAERAPDGGWSTAPHAHLCVTARRWRDDPRKGQRMRCWLYSKAQLEAAEAIWLMMSGQAPRNFVLA